MAQCSFPELNKTREESKLESSLLSFPRVTLKPGIRNPEPESRIRSAYVVLILRMSDERNDSL